MPLQEIVIFRCVDPDFGALELIETRTQASLDGGPLSPLIYREWTGKCENLDAAISISNTDNPPRVADETRAAFRAVVSDVGDFKRRIARSELKLARDWPAQAGMNFDLNEDSFCGLLEIEALRLDEDRLTVWLRETANIFGGHTLEARLERGEIIEVCLAG
jgi:hypothetical protein